MRTGLDSLLPNPTKSTTWFCLILMDSVLHSIAQQIEHVSHVYQFHQIPPAVFVGFRMGSSQAMDALHLLLYQFHQSPTIGVLLYWMLMYLGGFGMVSSQNALGVRVKVNSKTQLISTNSSAENFC